MAEQDERELLNRSRAGDSEAFGTLVDRHSRVIFGLALRMTGNAEDARDVTQAAFVKAWSRLSSFKGESRFFSWLYRIAVNEALNVRRSRRPSEPLDEREPAGTPGPEERLERRQDQARVQRALMQLRDEDRELVVLRHFMGYSYVEMSDLLHVPEKTVKSRLHTALLRLETALRRLGFGHP